MPEMRAKLELVEHQNKCQKGGWLQSGLQTNVILVTLPIPKLFLETAMTRGYL
jgi:hypothetical protein